MKRGGPVSEKEEAEILEALKAGRSVRAVGAEFGRGKTTVSDIAKRNGLDLADVRRTKNATLAKSCYASEERIKLISEALNKGRELLAGCTSARDFQSIMTGLAIGIDKRRLEEATDPTAGKGGEILELFEKMKEGAGE